jgi:hypothetical protein
MTAMDTRNPSKNSGQPIPADVDPSGRLSSASRKQLEVLYRQTKLSVPQDDLPLLSSWKNESRDSFHTQRHGSTADDGNRSRMMSRQQESRNELPTVATRRLLNVQRPQWRTGFGKLMVLLSASHNRAFSAVEVKAWALFLGEYDLPELNEGFVEFMKTAEAFPTPGKVEKFVKKCRRDRLGIVVR